MPSVTEKHQPVIWSNSTWASWDSISEVLNMANLKRIKFLNMSSGETKIRNIDIFSKTYLFLALKDGGPANC